MSAPAALKGCATTTAAFVSGSPKRAALQLPHNDGPQPTVIGQALQACLRTKSSAAKGLPYNCPTVRTDGRRAGLLGLPQSEQEVALCERQHVGGLRGQEL